MCLGFVKILGQESREMPTYGMPATGETAFTPDGLESVGPEDVAWCTMDSSCMCTMGTWGQLGGQGGLPGGSDTSDET